MIRYQYFQISSLPKTVYRFPIGGIGDCGSWFETSSEVNSTEWRKVYAARKDSMFVRISRDQARKLASKGFRKEYFHKTTVGYY